MKKIIFLTLILTGSLGSFVFAQSSLTLSTYYPAPYGAYDRLRLVPQTSLPACEIGSLAVLSPSDLKFCRNKGDGTGEWVAFGIWTQTGTDVYLTDQNSGLKVGIGTVVPSSKLHVSGGADAADVRIEGDSDGSGSTVSLTLRERAGGGSPVTGQLGFFGSADLTLKNIYPGGKINLSTNDIPRLTIDGSGKVGINDQSPGALLEITRSGAFDYLHLSSNDTSAGDILRVRNDGLTLINFSSTDTPALTNSRLVIKGMGATTGDDDSEIAFGGNGDANGSYDMLYDGGTVVGKDPGVARFVHYGAGTGSLIFNYLDTADDSLKTLAQIRNDGLFYAADKLSVGKDPSLVNAATELQVHETDPDKDLTVVLSDDSTSTGFTSTPFSFINTETLGVLMPWKSLTVADASTKHGGLQIVGLSDGDATQNVPGLSLVGAIGNSATNNIPAVDISGYKQNAGSIVSLSGAETVLGVNYYEAANTAFMVLANGNVGIGFTAGAKPTQKLHIKNIMRLEPLGAKPTGTEACTAGSPGPQNGSLYVNTSGALCFCHEGTWYKAGGSAAGACPN